MHSKNEDLHGNVPDHAPVVLLIIDMINDLEFEGGDALLEHALPVAQRIAALKRRARAAGIPTIYVNDNFGRWRSDFQDVLDHCLHDGVRGQPLAELLQPDEDDYFVLKPKHSGFYSTTLDTLLDYLDARHLLLTGLTGDTCVLFTANDAYMRDLDLSVPADCVASISADENEAALRFMRRVLHVDTTPSDALTLRGLGNA
jgi:nicotinamidase-related amidase